MKLMLKLEQSRGSSALQDKNSEDKLLQTKKRDKLVHEQRREQLTAKKEQTLQERLARGAAYREIRALNGTSRRAAKDARQASKKEDRQKSGRACEHGVWRCKICFPRG